MIGLGSDKNGYLSSHILLEGCRGGSSAVHLPVKDTGGEERAGNLLDVRRQHLGGAGKTYLNFIRTLLLHLWLVGTSKCPANITSGVSDVGTNREIAFALVVDQSSQDVWHHLETYILRNGVRSVCI